MHHYTSLSAWRRSQQKISQLALLLVLMGVPAFGAKAGVPERDQEPPEATAKPLKKKVGIGLVTASLWWLIKESLKHATIQELLDLIEHKLTKFTGNDTARNQEVIDLLKEQLQRKDLPEAQKVTLERIIRELESQAVKLTGEQDTSSVNKLQKLPDANAEQTDLPPAGVPAEMVRTHQKHIRNLCRLGGRVFKPNKALLEGRHLPLRWTPPPFAPGSYIVLIHPDDFDHVTLRGTGKRTYRGDQTGTSKREIWIEVCWGERLAWVSAYYLIPHSIRHLPPKDGTR